jgi:hypothetical protein
VLFAPFAASIFPDMYICLSLRRPLTQSAELTQSCLFRVCSKYNKIFFRLDESGVLTRLLSSHSSFGEQNALFAPFLARNKLLQDNGLACVSCPIFCTASPHNPYPPPRGIPIALVDAALRELRVASWDAAMSTPACVFDPLVSFPLA